MNKLQDETQVPVCVCCGDSVYMRHNPLITLVDKYDDEAVVHLLCAKNDRRFGFCRFCGGLTAYLSDNINEAGECPDHKGESIPDCPDEDIESYIENIEKQ